MLDSFFDMPVFPRDFAPEPARTWEKDGEDCFICQAGRATLRVFRFGAGKPWWAE